MNLNCNTFSEFEAERQKYSFFPPDQSDSFYTIGESNISLFTSNEGFNLTVSDGEMHIGDPYTFNVSLYRTILVNEDASIVVDESVGIDRTLCAINGSIVMEEGSSLNVSNTATITFNSGSELTINKGCSLSIEDECCINMYGTINVDVNLIDKLLANDRVIIDSSAVVKLLNVNLGDREFSLTDYNLKLQDESITPNTRGEYAVEDGRIAYTWKAGNYDDNYRRLELSSVYGQCVLGDYQLPVLGSQIIEIPGSQIIQSLHVESDTTVYISDSYKGYTYLRPNLYIGAIIGNTKTPGSAVVDGTVIVDGGTACITIDRDGQLTISEGGKVYLQNGSKLISSNNVDTCVLHVNGTLVIDFIDQISSLEYDDIEFGENGKLVVLNPYEEETLLLTIPDGRSDTDLYRIIGDRFDHIEYHMTKNTGIKIDHYYEYYGSEMMDWFGGRRIEQAAYDGILVWEEGAFIVLDNSIIPWATLDSNLYHAARLFKSYYSDDAPRLREVVKHLVYAGFKSVRFRFVEGEESVDIMMTLDTIKMESITNTPNSTEYDLGVDNNGALFIKKQATDISESGIVSEDSYFTSLEEGHNKFNIS